VIPDKTQPPPQEAKLEPQPPPELRPPQPDQPKPKPKPVKTATQQAKPATKQAADFNSLLKNLTSQQTASIDQSPPQPQPDQQQAAASPSTQGPPLTASELDAVRSQIESHWNFDPGKKGASDVLVEIRVTAGPDGSVIGMPQIVDMSRMGDPVYRSIAESARRAILLSSPLKLPPDKYANWSGEGGLLLRFTPQGIL
jgi:outer membrane biosynthesis protein TonB